jgi:Ser-tRNA(Ala) deacylase AlaX
MNQTKLLYMEDMESLECSAFVESVNRIDGKEVVTLDQTVFYPQGGGQPYDTGEIDNEDTKFVVEEVRFVDGEVLHIGQFDGRKFIQGEDVKCKVDEARRNLHSRLHSAGHVINMAVDQLGYVEWVPTKGFHFPEGSYVEYETKEDIDKEKLKVDLEKTIADIITKNPKAEITFLEASKLSSICKFVPEYVPKDKPSRVISYDGFGIPCGGTHVKELKGIGKITIKKLKTQAGTLRISYQIS